MPSSSNTVVRAQISSRAGRRSSCLSRGWPAKTTVKREPRCRVFSMNCFTRLWPFLSRQGGERSLTIDDLCERSHYRRRTAHATPARSSLTRLSPFCATLFPAGLGPRANLALGRASGPRRSYCDGCLADHGVGPGAAIHERPPGPQPGHLVGTPGQSDSARVAPHGPGAPRGHDRLRCRRHGGTPVRAEDQSERLLPGCGALHHKARHPLLWLAVGVHDALGASALEPAGVGVALFDRPLLAQAKARHTTAYNQCGLGAADDETGASLAARATAGLGRRWWLRGRIAGAGLCQKSGDHGLAPALGCGAVLPPRTTVHGQTRSQTPQGQAPTELAGLGRAQRYALGDRGSHVVRWPAQKALGLLAHGPVVYSRVVPRSDPLRAGGGPGGPPAHGSVLLYRSPGYAGADPGVGRHALVARGDV